MSRMEELESRRRVLIARCELQRVEMALRAKEFSNDPVRKVLAGVLGNGAHAPGSGSLRHPLAWTLAIAGLFLLRRPRQLLTVLGWARSAVTLATKASVAMRILAQLRGSFARSPRERRPARSG